MKRLDFDTLETLISGLDGCHHLRFITPEESWQSSERRFRTRDAYNYETQRYERIEADPNAPIAWDTEYGRWHELRASETITADSFFVVDYASGSDYSGDLVEQSNYRVILGLVESAELEENRDYITYTGGHGTFALAIRVGALVATGNEDTDGWLESILETIYGLEDYPLADESDHSEMELEAQNEAWEDYARSEFKTELSKYFHAQYFDCSASQYSIVQEMLEDTDWITDDFANSIAWEMANYANVYWVNEQGDSMYLDVEEMVSRGLEPNKHWPEIAAKQAAMERAIIREIHKQGTAYVLSGGAL